MSRPLGTGSAPRKRGLRWFQFSLRGLLGGMLLVGCGLGWLIHGVRERAAVVQMLEQHGEVEFGEPNFFGRLGVVQSLFGEHAFAPVTSVTLRHGTTAAHVLQLKKLKELKSLSLIQVPVSDLSPLAGLSGLKGVYISENQDMVIPESLKGVVQRW